MEKDAPLSPPFHYGASSSSFEEEEDTNMLYAACKRANHLNNGLSRDNDNLQMPPPPSLQSNMSPADDASYETCELQSNLSSNEDNLQMPPQPSLPSNLSHDDVTNTSEIEEPSPEPRESNLSLPFLRNFSSSSFSFNEDKYDKNSLPIPHTKPSLGFLSHRPAHPCCDGEVSSCLHSRLESKSQE